MEGGATHPLFLPRWGNLFGAGALSLRGLFNLRRALMGQPFPAAAPPHPKPGPGVPRPKAPSKPGAAPKPQVVKEPQAA